MRFSNWRFLIFISSNQINKSSLIISSKVEKANLIELTMLLKISLVELLTRMVPEISGLNNLFKDG